MYRAIVSRDQQPIDGNDLVLCPGKNLLTGSKQMAYYILLIFIVLIWAMSTIYANSSSNDVQGEAGNREVGKTPFGDRDTWDKEYHRPNWTDD